MGSLRAAYEPDSGFLEFLIKEFKLPRGRQFVVRPFMLPVYAYPLAERRYLAIQKASQLGMSTYAIARAIYECKRRQCDVMYVLSSWPVVKKFVLSKINPILASMAIRADPDSVETKGLWNSMLHFTGGQKVTQAISITADFLILDEFSFLDPTTRDTFEDRLLASEDAMTLCLSIPSGSESGIESIVAATKLFIWHVKCKSCNRTVPLDPREYERIIRLGEDGYTWKFMCLACEKPLDPNDPDAVEVRANGFYLPMNPQAEADGFLVSTLYNPERSAAWFKDMERKRDATRFYPGVIGVPYVTSVRVEFTDLIKKVLPESEWTEPKSVPVVAGVDYGKVFHIVYVTLSDPPTVVRLSVAADWREALDELIIFRPVAVLIDELPPGENYTLRDELMARGSDARLALARAPHNITGDILVDRKRVVYNNTKAFNDLFGAIAAPVEQNGLQFLRSRRLEELFVHILRARRVMATLKGRMYQTWEIAETAHFLDALKMAFLCRQLTLLSRSPFSANQAISADSAFPQTEFSSSFEFVDYIVTQLTGMSE